MKKGFELGKGLMEKVGVEFKMRAPGVNDVEDYLRLL